MSTNSLPNSAPHPSSPRSSTSTSLTSSSSCPLPTSRFLDYVRAFNARDYEKQHSFYTSSIELVLPADPPQQPLHGNAAILEHYKSVHAVAHETVVPQVIMSSPTRIFFVMDAFFKYYRTPDRKVHGVRVEEGDVLMLRIWAIYDLDGLGRIGRITCNLYERECLGKVDVKERIEESERRADAGLRISCYDRLGI